MPLKQTVLPLLDVVSGLARATGAANTLVLRDGERHGDNTDVGGIVDALAEGGARTASAGVVVGAGATAASALAALAQLGERRPRVLLRDASRAAALRSAAERLGVEPRLLPLDLTELSDADVVISTVPAGALDDRVGARVTGSGVLLDVVYDPWPTPLVRAWSGPVVSGAAMLLHQAARQVQLMTGRPAPLPQMRAALPGGRLSRSGSLPPR